LVIYGAAALVTYLVVMLAVFATLRSVGYNVQCLSVIWPPAWHRISESRASFFIQKAYVSLANGNLREASSALAIACDLNPQNYNAAVMLARLRELSNPQMADEIYARLLRTHPKQAAITATMRLHALLARGDYEHLQAASLEEISRLPPAQTIPWLHALIFSCRYLHDNAALRQLRDTSAGVPWRRVLDAEILLQDGHTSEAIAALAQPWSPLQPYFAYYQIKQLLSLDRVQDAVSLMSVYRSIMPGDEVVATLLAANAQLGQRKQLLRDVRALLQPPPTPAIVELIATHLIRYSDPDVMQLTLDRLNESPLPDNEAGYRAYNALFCAAGVSGNRDQLRVLAVIIKQRAGTAFYSLNIAEDFFLGNSSARRIESFLPSFVLSTETLYALLEWNPRIQPVVTPASEPTEAIGPR